MPVQAGYIRDLVFPINGQYTINNNFGDPRDGGAREHEAIDIMAAKMTPVVAVVDGTISYIVIPEAYWGYALYLKDSEGWQYHYLHLNNDTPGTDDGNGGPANAYAPGIARNTQVTAGQHLGWVGDSGNAEYAGSHLHFEMHRPDKTVINPYESLLAATKPGQITNPEPLVKTTIIIVKRGGSLIKYAASPKVYYLINNTKQHIADEESFLALGFAWTDIRVLSASETYRTGLPIKMTDGAIAVYEDGTPLVVDGQDDVAAYVFSKDLAIGSRGEDVRQLQSLLLKLGYYTYPSITGYYDPVTQTSVKAFQQAYGISPVGRVGPQTRAALNNR